MVKAILLTYIVRAIGPYPIPLTPGYSAPFRDKQDVSFKRPQTFIPTLASFFRFQGAVFRLFEGR